MATFFPVKKPVLSLFLTKDMSLKEWERLGLLNREMALYETLMAHFLVQIYSYGNVADLAFERQYPDLRVLIIPYYRRHLTLKNRWHLFKAERALSRSSVLKTNQIRGSEAAVHYAQRFGIPLVTRCGYLHSVFTRNQTKDEAEIARAFALEREAFSLAAHGITSSARDRDFVVQTHQIAPNKMTVVPNYVDQSVFKPDNSVQKQAGHLLFIGRLSPQKNLPALLEAFEKSTAKRLSIIGQGVLESELKNQAAGLSKPIDFLGALPNIDLPQWIHRTQIYVLPSHYEGLPKTLLEAMGCGACCLGTAVEGIREVIHHGKDGWLCEPAADSIAEALDVLLKADALRKKLGGGAVETIASTYSLDGVSALEKEILEKVSRS